MVESPCMHKRNVTPALREGERERKSEEMKIIAAKQSNTEPCNAYPTLWRSMELAYDVRCWFTNTKTPSENEKLFSFFLLLINSCHLYSVEFAAFKKLPNKLFALRSHI